MTRGLEGRRGEGSDIVEVRGAETLHVRRTACQWRDHCVST